MPAAAGGLCSGASRARSSISASTSSSTTVGATSRGPPCTTRWPTATRWAAVIPWSARSPCIVSRAAAWSRTSGPPMRSIAPRTDAVPDAGSTTWYLRVDEPALRTRTTAGIGFTVPAEIWIVQEPSRSGRRASTCACCHWHCPPLCRPTDSRAVAHQADGAFTARVGGGGQLSIGSHERGADSAVVHGQALVGLALDDLVGAAGVVDVDAGVVDGFLEAEAADEPGEDLRDGRGDPAGAGGPDGEDGAVGVAADGRGHVGEQAGAGGAAVEAEGVELLLAEGVVEPDAGALRDHPGEVAR